MAVYTIRVVDCMELQWSTLPGMERFEGNCLLVEEGGFCEGCGGFRDGWGCRG